MPPGTQVYYCYRATNTGDAPLVEHSVEDSRLGPIWVLQERTLGPGESFSTVDEGLTLDSRVERGEKAQVTWTSSAVTATLETSATAQAEVVVVSAGVIVTKTAGIAGTGCQPGSKAVVPDGEDAEFCIVVENTGRVPLVQHTLTDPLLELDATFVYTLPPAGLLTITHDALADLGVDGSLVRNEVTRTVVNRVYYTATSPADSAATGALSASDVASVTVGLANAGLRITATVGTDPAVCSDAIQLTLSNPNTEFYNCAILHNTGNVPITQHRLGQPVRNLVSEFSRTLAPGEILSVTNALLEEMGAERTLGPMTVRDRPSSSFSNVLAYTGTTSLALGQEGETRSYTVTTRASTYAGLPSTPTSTATATNTPRSSDSRATNTPRPQATATWTPVSPLATPDVAAQQAPTLTPTPTRSYQISLLETPTSQPVSPLALPAAAQAATLEAAATLAALDATATAVASSPLAAPTEIPSPTPAPSNTPAPATGMYSPTAAVLVVVATETPPPVTQRPVVLPPPAPTPDALLFAARTVDAMVMTATWIWFLVGTLVFFVVAGVLVGLSFRQNERRRFDLVDAGLVEEYEFLVPPPAGMPDADDDADNDVDNGLESLP